MGGGCLPGTGFEVEVRLSRSDTGCHNGGQKCKWRDWREIND